MFTGPGTMQCECQGREFLEFIILLTISTITETLSFSLPLYILQVTKVSQRKTRPIVIYKDKYEISVPIFSHNQTLNETRIQKKFKTLFSVYFIHYVRQLICYVYILFKALSMHKKAYFKL